MCGLTALFHPDPSGAIDPAALRRMTDALAHRGPDGDGFHVEPGVGLGHRRLAIIDIVGGHQPMWNEDETVAIVFNGEIYNFAELWTELKALGHRFRSHHSDTEAVVHAWESWGPDCLARLNGMFSLILWDRTRRQLFVARDRLGKKPLYYAALADGTLAFASEMQALATLPGLARRIDAAAVEDFFTFGYVQEPRTIYRGVHKLPAAHFMVVERGRPPQPMRYWSPPVATVATTEADAVAGVTEHLRRSTALRLVSDVPLGAFLSGGVDSSAVVATAAGLRDAPLDTFTIGFDGAEDETPFARMMSARYGTIQHEERAAEVDPIAAARLQGSIFGEPFGDSSSVPTFSVCRLARRHATVAISGDGGDEVFAGYRRYQWHRLNEAVRRHVPAGLRRHVVGGLAAAYPKMDWAPRFLRAKYTLTELSLDSALGYFRTVTKLHRERRRALFAPATAAQLDGYDPAALTRTLMDEAAGADPLLQAQYVDVNTWLPGDILTKVDRASMANSLEVRAPLLDYRLVEWGMALPPELKLQGANGKRVLKRAMEPLVPHEILYRPKQGFATSHAALFRSQAGRLRARLLGAPMLDSGLFQPGSIARLIDEHAHGRLDHSQALWLLLVFEGFLAADHVEARALEAA